MFFLTSVFNARISWRFDSDYFYLFVDVFLVYHAVFKASHKRTIGEFKHRLASTSSHQLYRRFSPFFISGKHAYIKIQRNNRIECLNINELLKWAVIARSLCALTHRRKFPRIQFKPGRKHHRVLQKIYLSIRSFNRLVTVILRN